jgi:hypothetical protein
VIGTDGDKVYIGLLTLHVSSDIPGFALGMHQRGYRPTFRL